MENLTLFKILKTFTKVEMKELRKFVNSPVFNNRNEVIKYYEVLNSYHKKILQKKITQIQIWNSLYPNKKYSESSSEKLKKLNSFLLQVIYKYLSYKGITTDDFYLKQSLVVKLNEKGKFELSKKHLELLDEEYRFIKSDASNFFWKKFQIEQDRASGYTYSGEDHLASEALQNRARYFIHHTILTSSSVFINLFINEMNFNTDNSISGYYEFFDNLKFEKSLNKMRKSRDEFYYVSAIYYFQAMALRNLKEKSYYENFRNLLYKYGNRFSYIDRINFYSILQAICTLKTESGIKEYEEELFNAYSEMLKQDLISINEGGYFMVKLFRNFIQTGVLLKRYDWIESLIKNYSHRLPPESKDSLLNLTEALILFEREKFDKSLEKLSLINYDIFHFKIDLKLLQLRNFIELEYINEAYSLIDTFKHFISGNKFISNRYRDKLRKFLLIISKYIKLKEKKDTTGLNFLLKEISSNELGLYNDWIKEKIKNAG